MENTSTNAPASYKLAKKLLNFPTADKQRNNKVRDPPTLLHQPYLVFIARVAPARISFLRDFSNQQTLVYGECGWTRE